MAKEEKKNGCLIKVYLIILFVAGIILGLSYQSAKKDKTVQTSDRQQTASVQTEQKNEKKSDKENKEEKEILLDNSLLTALTSKGIEQQNVLSQYIKEIESKGSTYNVYYKEIKLNKGQKPENFEPVMKTLARNFKIGLKKTKNADGSYKYLFYDKKRTYSELILK